MDLAFAIDLSNFSGIPSPACAQRIAAAGFKRAILSTYDPDVFARQYDVLSAAGLEIQGYAYLNFPGGRFYSGIDGAGQIEVALRHLGGRVCSMFAIDCEDDAAFKRPAGDNLAFIRAAADACAGKVFSYIYTRRDWWERCTGDSQEFAPFKLWDCTADKTPDLGRAGYGGWDVPWMEQYAFDQLVGADEQGADGVTADLNVYGADLPAVIAASPTVETHEQMQLAVAAIEVIAALAARSSEMCRVDGIEQDGGRIAIRISAPYPLPVEAAFVNQP